MPKGAFAATLLATLAIGYAATHLGLSLIPVNAPDLPTLAEGQGVLAPETVASDGPWPAVFGTPPPTVAAPPPPSAPKPSTRYSLKGLIAQGGGGWAVLTDGSEEFLVQVGETLKDGATVVVIDRHGVTLERDGVLSQVGFTASAPPPSGGAASVEQDSAEIASITTTRTELDLSGLDPSDLRRILARAGAIEQVQLADGGKALDLLWIRNGLLFDKLGLQAGDRILQINGIDVGDDQAVLRAAGQLMNADTYRIDLLRNGERHAIEVEVLRNG